MPRVVFVTFDHNDFPSIIDGGSGSIDSANDARALLLCGQPIAEPIVGQGPFVMNTPQEIRSAIEDYQNGKMGHLA